MSAEKSQIIAFLKNFFEENVAFAKHTGIELIEISAGVGSARLEDRVETRNHLGTQHAGALFTVGEAASGAASAAVFADTLGSASALITDATIHYQRSARGTMVATGKLRVPAAQVRKEFEQNGDVAFVVDVTLQDGAGVQVAEMKVNWRVKLR